MTNRLIVAAAGSGKTQLLVEQSIGETSGRVLITTFTQANEAEIRRRFYEEAGCIPSHITVQTWYSFVLQHGARPYQNNVFAGDICGLVIPEGQSTRGVAESDTHRHYFTRDHKIYSDKLAKFALKCNAANQGSVIERLSRIYNHIYVDEIQDIAGHDLDFLKAVLTSGINVLLVGDPRQSVYATSNAARNRQFRGSSILGFFEDDSLKIEPDAESLNINYRCVEEICVLANSLYPNFSATRSGQEERTGHDGLFVVRPAHIDMYLAQYHPTQLRYRVGAGAVRAQHPCTNFGISKGMQFDRTLIFPTQAIVKWLGDSASPLEPQSRAKFYVALTRARFSVAIVSDAAIPGISQFIPEQG